MELKPQRDEDFASNSGERDSFSQSRNADYDHPEFTFITHTGAAQKTLETQNLVRKHVMQKVGRSRRGLVPARYRVMNVSLETADLQTGYPPESKFEFPSGTISDNSNTQNIARNDSTAIKQPIMMMHALNPRETSFTSMKRQPEHPSQSHPDTNSMIEMSHEALGEFDSTIERFGGGRSNPFAQYPIEMNLQRHEIIDRIFNNQDLDLRQFRESWIPLGMIDPAAFHQVLANSLLHMSRHRVGPLAESYEATSHHIMALRSVNSRILDPKFVLSDGFLGTILAFSCYYNTIGQQSKTDIHLAGLKEIVLRRGLDSLDLHPLIRAILFWVDLGISTIRDLPPNYPLPNNFSYRPIFSSQVFVPASCSQIIGLCRLKFTEHMELFDIIEDIAQLTAWLKSEIIRTRGLIYTETQAFAEYFNPLIYRLLKLAPLSSIDTRSNCLEACRLASILYLAEVRRKFGVSPVWSQVQLDKLWMLFENFGLARHELAILELWVLAMGFIEEQNEERKKQYLARMRNAVVGEGLALAGYLGNRLNEFIWMDLHQEKLHYLLGRTYDQK